jgi:hypothetical protein
MRTWISFPTGIRGIRLGAAANLNTRARIYRVSAIGRRVWNTGSTPMLAGLAIWLVASRDQDGRLNEVWWLVVSLVLAVRYCFKLVVVAAFPPQTTAGRP